MSPGGRRCGFVATALAAALAVAAAAYWLQPWFTLHVEVRSWHAVDHVYACDNAAITGFTPRADTAAVLVMDRLWLLAEVALRRVPTSDAMPCTPGAEPLPPGSQQQVWWCLAVTPEAANATAASDGDVGDDSGQDRLTCVPVGAGPRTALSGAAPGLPWHTVSRAGRRVGTEVLLTPLQPGRYSLASSCLVYTVGHPRGPHHGAAVARTAAQQVPACGTGFPSQWHMNVLAIGPPPPRAPHIMDRRQPVPAFPTAHHHVLAGTAGDIGLVSVRPVAHGNGPWEPPLELQFAVGYPGSWLTGRQGPQVKLRVYDVLPTGYRSDSYRPHSTSEAFDRVCMFTYVTDGGFAAPWGRKLTTDDVFAPGAFHADSPYSGRPLVAGSRVTCFQPRFTEAESGSDPFVNIIGFTAVVIDANNKPTSFSATSLMYSGLGGATGAFGGGEYQKLTDRRHLNTWYPECGTEAAADAPLLACRPQAPDVAPAAVAGGGDALWVRIGHSRAHADGVHPDVAPPEPTPVPAPHSADVAHVDTNFTTLPADPPELAGVAESIGAAVQLRLRTVAAANAATAAAAAVPVAVRGRFAVVVVGMPDNVNQNLLVFEDVAALFHSALLALGHDSRRFECADLTKRCATAEALQHRQAIIIGSNVLGHYLDPDTRQPVVLTVPLIPDNAVLYNLEHVVPQVRQFEVALEEDMSVPTSWMTPLFIAVHNKYRVWDYAAGNVARWATTYHMAATHVPLGFAPSMRKPLPPADTDTNKDIDVLFFGMNSPRREAMFAALEAAPNLTVVWPDSLVIGPALDALIARAKVTLVLRIFPQPDELKMTRLMVLFANRAFVVSERMGAAADTDYYVSGMVQVDVRSVNDDVNTPHPDDVATFAAVVRFFVRRPDLRHAVAANGHALYTASGPHTWLRPAVDALLSPATVSHNSGNNSNGST